MNEQLPSPDGSNAASSQAHAAGDGEHRAGSPTPPVPTPALPSAPQGHPPFDPANGDISRCPFFRALSGALGAFTRESAQRPSPPHDGS